MKIFNAVVSIIVLCTYNLNFPIPNFELISADPTIPIHIQVNGGQWQTLNQKHYRFPVEVPENMLLIVSLSAYDDKSAPTSLIFAPERILDTAKELGITSNKSSDVLCQCSRRNPRNSRKTYNNQTRRSYTSNKALSAQ
jgi:hypothetical protein